MKDGLKIDDLGNKRWYKNGLIHREGGPAIIHRDGWECWSRNGQVHREDGPAIEWPGHEKAWWYNGQKIDCSSQKEFERLLKLKAFW